MDENILYYRERHLYQKTLDLIAAQKTSEARTIVDQFVSRQRPWIEAQVDHYVNAIRIVCQNLEYPIYTLCAIGKPVLGRINDAVEWTFRDFCTKLSPRKIVRFNEFTAPGREFAAAVELNIACNENCAGFVATNGSTFSATVFQRIPIDKQLYTLTFSEIEMPIYV